MLNGANHVEPERCHVEVGRRRDRLPLDQRRNPAYNAERTIGKVLEALRSQQPPPAEIIVVDDGSVDATGAVHVRLGAHVVRTEGRGYAEQRATAGGTQQRETSSCSSTRTPFRHPAGARDSHERSPSSPARSSAVGGRSPPARPGDGSATSRARLPTCPWGNRGRLRSSAGLHGRSSTDALRWDESYGGEDGIFCADALSAGIDLVFDPRFHTFHDHEKDSFAKLRRQQDRLAYSIARVGPVQREATSKTDPRKGARALSRARASAGDLPART